MIVLRTSFGFDAFNWLENFASTFISYIVFLVACWSNCLENRRLELNYRAGGMGHNFATALHFVQKELYNPGSLTRRRAPAILLHVLV